MPQNQSWRSGLQGQMTLQQYYDTIGRLVKEKTGRAMQTKEGERINKKAGTVTKIAGCTPLREGVVVCKADTTMDNCNILQTFAGSVSALQPYKSIFIETRGIARIQAMLLTWKAKYHGHIIWDWMNHDTGKSYKLDNEDISLMQERVSTLSWKRKMKK